MMLLEDLSISAKIPLPPLPKPGTRFPGSKYHTLEQLITGIATGEGLYSEINSKLRDKLKPFIRYSNDQLKQHYGLSDDIINNFRINIDEHVLKARMKPQDKKRKLTPNRPPNGNRWASSEVLDPETFE